MESDEFEWDDVKAAANLKKHKISFGEASRIFQDPFACIEQDFTEDYGEDRFIAIGLVHGLHITVTFVERDNRIRIISARRAIAYEKRAYHQS